MSMDFEAPVSEMAALPSSRTEFQQDEMDRSTLKTKVITTGNIYFKSESIEQDYALVKQLLPQFRAYIQSENQSRNANRIDYSLTIKVPQELYDSLFEAIVSMDVFVESKSSNLQDVTEQYYDLETRIKNKKALEGRYLELLEKTKTITDILSIEQNLNNVRTEIERLEGQFKYLNNQVQYSTIYLSFYEVLPYEYQSSSRKGFFARILSSFDRGWDGFLSFIVWFFGLWPFLLLAGAGIYGFRKYRLKRKRQ